MRSGQMRLDLKNNELIFSMVQDPKEFRIDIKAMKGVKHREYKGKFYLSLADFDVIQMVLSKKYRGRIAFSMNYLRFAEHFVKNKEPITIDWYPANCYISGKGIPWKDIIPATSYFDKKAKNSKQYGKSWSGYTHLFNPTEGSFPSGLLERITGALGRYGIVFQVNRKFDYPDPYIHLHPVFEFTPTQDQVDAVTALNKANYGIGKLPTGFGKTSYVAAALIAKKGVKSLFLANQRVLTDDAKSDFDSVFANDDIEIGMIGDGKYEPRDITVASIQTIAASLKPPTEKERQSAQFALDLAEQRRDYAKDDTTKIDAIQEVDKLKKRLTSIDKRIERSRNIIPFLKQVDMFIVDEAQVLGTEQWNQFLNACPAPYRYTLSATDTRTDGGRVQIIAATGERRYESSADEQIKKGRLSEFNGHFIKFDHKMEKEVIKDLHMEYHQAYDVFIVQNEKRNEHLCQKVIEWARDYSVLALVTRREHGEIVKEMLESMGLPEGDAHFIDGQTAKKKRKDTIEAFREGKFPVLIGTSIFDVGFNAKNASKIVRFNAGGSEVREPQRAGRTVRLRDDGSIGESYDIVDINCPFFEAQGWKRMKFLKDEFGKNRVHVSRKVIEGELNVVGLKEIVEAAPAETDREKGYEIIQALQFHDTDLDDIETPEYEVDHLEGDLADILSNLEMPE